MNCEDCKIGAIQRLIACGDCNNGENFEKIFKLKITVFKIKKREIIMEKMNQSCEHDLGEWIVETDKHGFHSGYRHRKCIKCKQVVVREKLRESYD